MSLTLAQRQALKASIAADGVLGQLPHTQDNAFDIALAYSLAASPAFIVWRTNVTRSEIYNNTSAEDTNWDWSKYKAQNVTEQNSWTQMFMGDQADFSKPNLRAGISNIFTSASAVNATHAFAIGKRSANRIEKLLSTGTGSTASPATMGYEGGIQYQDVLDAWAS